MTRFIAVAFASLVASAAVHAFSLTMIGNPVEIADPSLKEREENALAAYDRINAMIKDGKLTEALTAAETAIKDYAGCPDGLHLLRGAKVYLLVRLPDKKKAADKFAADWIADIKRERNPLHEFRCRQLAASLLNAADTPDAKARDLQLVELATALLHDTDENLHLYTQGRKESHVLSYRVHIRMMLAQAFSLRDEPMIAVRQIEAAIALQKKSQPTEGDDDKEFWKEHARLIMFLTNELAKHKHAAESQPKKK